jgi:hypothetical protein
MAPLALLAAMVAMMWQPMREEVATRDEPVFLAAGYTYLKGMGSHLDPEQPPLAKEWSALPLLFMDVKLSERAGRYLDPQSGYPETRTWSDERVPVQALFPLGRDSWYFRPLAEGIAFGNLLLYDGINDAEKLLFSGRLMQVVLTLLTGAAIFFWIRQLAGGEAAVFGTALWVFNPIALAYGHLILTDMGAALTILLGVWSFSKLLEQPTSSRAVLVGLATGGALLMKFTAVLLVPIYATMAAVWWWKSPPERQRLSTVCKVIALAGLATWVTILLGYEPFWSPAPSLPAEQAARMGVPWWFQHFRFCLIPPDFFKGLACQIGHSHVGHSAYLCGRWPANRLVVLLPRCPGVEDTHPLAHLATGWLVPGPYNSAERPCLVLRALDRRRRISGFCHEQFDQHWGSAFAADDRPAYRWDCGADRLATTDRADRRLVALRLVGRNGVS